jgi:hypothetical protein
MANPRGTPENLRPAKPGEVRNPEGHNQYTCQRAAIKAFNRLAKEVEGDETRMVQFLRALWADAISGKPCAVEQLAKRLLPIAEKHDVSLTASDDESLAYRLAGIARAKRANGHDLEAESTGEETPQ